MVKFRCFIQSKSTLEFISKVPTRLFRDHSNIRPKRFWPFRPPSTHPPCNQTILILYSLFIWPTPPYQPLWLHNIWMAPKQTWERWPVLISPLFRTLDFYSTKVSLISYVYGSNYYEKKNHFFPTLSKSSAFGRLFGSFVRHNLTKSQNSLDHLDGRSKKGGSDFWIFSKTWN